MILYLLRHAEAEFPAPSDSERRLTEKGEAQALRTGKFCRRHGISPSLVLTSPFARARQTAQIVAQSIEGAELVEVAWAACGMDPWTASAELEKFAKFPSVMLVGHQPDLGGLAALLLGVGDVGALHVRKSLLCAIDVPRGFRNGVLEFFVPAKLMD